MIFILCFNAVCMSIFVRHMHRTPHPFPLGHHLHHMRGLCVASEEILEFLYLTPPRHNKQTCSALGLIATFTSFSMASKLLTQFLVRVVQLWHWHKKTTDGYAWCTSHWWFWLKRRSSAAITRKNLSSEGCRYNARQNVKTQFLVRVVLMWHWHEKTTDG